MCSDKQGTQRSDREAVLNAAGEGATDGEIPLSWPEPTGGSAPSPALLAWARAGWERFVDSMEEDLDE
ncbi:hypothetical protein GCM10010302_13410 [Streptomyces polychromogenes]|uniref:DUF397 domain-containing protein n=1 Tax=Streptomyces polychromogenes TaxID=67342 RepID=A0ABP3ET34_9ACTN